MDHREWMAVSAVLAGAWPGEFTAQQEVAYLFVLGEYDRVDVEAAIKSLARAGARFRPSAGAIAGTIAQRHAPATFDEAWPVIRRALRLHHRDPDRMLAIVAASAGRHAAGWMAAYGVDRLMQEPTDDPDHGGAVLHRLRAHHDGLVATDTGRDRLLLALERGPRPRLGSGELRRLPMPAEASS